MPRESAADKGARYLAQHRLTVLRVDRERRVILAECRGSGENYGLGYTAGDGWWCTCPNLTRSCSHLHALKAVTTRPHHPKEAQ